MSVAGFFVAVSVMLGTVEPRPLDLLASMDLWQREGGVAESFKIEDGRLVGNWTRHEPAHLLTKADYENFELTFECKMTEYCEAGLFIHAPRNGAWRAATELELANFYGGGRSKYSSCSIFRHAAPLRIPVKPAGQWNAVKVLMDWPKLVVHINGELVHDIDMAAHDELRYKLRRGPIAIQNLGWDIEFRNMILTPLPDSEHAIALDNGRDLGGWTIDGGKAIWSVADGAIRSTGDGYLKHEKVVQDFDLSMYVRTSPAANGGVYFRWLRMDPFGDRGHEIQILDAEGAIMGTGSIYGLERGNDLPITPGQWQLLQLFVRGKEAVVYLNGVKSCATKELKHVRPGHICLQMHRGGTTIDYKWLRLRPVK